MEKRRTLEPTSKAALPSMMRFEAGDVLSKLEAAGLLVVGRVHLISVEAIQAALGARWAERKALVWDMAEAQILKRIGQQDFCARVSELEFALITPKLDCRNAQILAVKISREILHHFLGNTYDKGISIQVATSYVDQHLSCRQISEAELLAALPSDDGLDFVLSEAEDQAKKSNESVAKPTLGDLTTFSGQRLRFSNSVDPIIDLNKWALAGHRIEPKISFQRSGLPLSPQERRRLLPLDVEAIDLATLRRGVQRLSTKGGEARTTIILSVSFLTISNTRSRNGLLKQAYEKKNEMERSVIWEITDFDAGVPAGRLQDCIFWLSPVSRAVFIRAEPETLSAISEKSVGRSGLIFQPPAAFEDEDAAAAWLMSAGRAASNRSATLIAANLPSIDLLPLASSVGFTHATLRACQVNLQKSADPLQL